jgi:hypothetical protein
MTRNGPAWGPSALERPARLGLIRTSTLLTLDRVVVNPNELIRIALAANRAGHVAANQFSIIGMREEEFHTSRLYLLSAPTRTPARHSNTPIVRRLWPRTRLGRLPRTGLPLGIDARHVQAPPVHSMVGIGRHPTSWSLHALSVNVPRSAFLKRESAPLTWISRKIAEYNVAQGVLPPGLVQ